MSQTRSFRPSAFTIRLDEPVERHERGIQRGSLRITRKCIIWPDVSYVA
jgi:hypothetical protein